MLPEGKMHHSTVGITIVPNSFNPDPEADFKAITVQQFQMARRFTLLEAQIFLT